MKPNSIIHLQVEAKEGSLLETFLEKALRDRRANRLRLQKEYSEKVKKQLRKLGNGGL